MTIPRRRAVGLGVLAIGVVLLVAAFNGFACYDHDLPTFVLTTTLFVVPALVPALVSLVLPNPLRAVGACVLFVPWLLFAYYVDCIRPYAGGGASMVYVAVLLWGTQSAVLGALVTGIVTRALGIVVAER